MRGTLAKALYHAFSHCRLRCSVFVISREGSYVQAPESALVCVRYLLAALCAAGTVKCGYAQENWLKLPVTPGPVPGEQHGIAELNGIHLYYATIGSGSPVILLHGGLANSDYFGYQVKALMKYHKVVLIDSRGHGRSTRDSRPYSYDLLADDVVALMDKLKIVTRILSAGAMVRFLDWIWRCVIPSAYTR
jgi:hypothetical protein